MERHRYKVLPLDGTLAMSPDDEEWGWLVGDYLNSQPEIPPVFNRPGRYYDRIEKRVWFELGGKAYAERRVDDFQLRLDTLNHRPLAEVERQAIKALMNRGRCPKELREVYWLDNHVLDLKRIKYDTGRTVRRVLREDS